MKKNKYLLLIFVFILTILIGCKQTNNNTPIISNIVISSPTNLKLDRYYKDKNDSVDYILKFDEVEDVDGYYIKIGVRELNTDKVEVNINDYLRIGASYNISVKAYKNIDETTYYSEEASIDEDIFKIPSSMTFNLLDDDTYEVDCQSCNKFDITGTVVFPDYYNGKIVSTLAQRCLYRMYDSSQLLGFDDKGHPFYYLGESINSVTKNVILPKYLKKILDSAFRNCINLESINIPKTVDYIGLKAFENCQSLKEIDLPKGITFVACFENCIGLTEINLPDSVKTLKSNAFTNCINLEKINLDNIIEIEPNSLVNTKFINNIKEDFVILYNNLCVYKGDKTELHSEDYPQEGFENVNISLYQYCGNLEYIELPNYFNTVYTHIFDNCLNLKTVVIPEGYTKIESGAFLNCLNIEKIVIPKSMEMIDRFKIGHKGEIVPDIYYLGSEDDFANIEVPESFREKYDVYFYSNEKPDNEGLYWHYVNDEIVIWDN